MKMLLMDTHAWVEYFIDSPKAEKIKELMEDKSIYTCILSVSELHLWALRNKVEDKKYIQYIKENSGILQIDEEIALNAAKIKFNSNVKDNVKDFGLVDAIIYSTAIRYGLTVVSGDPHFKNLKNSVYIGD